MTRPMKILTRVAIGVAALIVLLLTATFFIVRTGRFREYVREKIITATEEGTGGRVELGSFNFEWRRLRATVSDFVIHGNEPADAAPFVRVPRVELFLRLFTSVRHPFELSYLGVERPQVNVIVFEDGHTNVPVPKQKSESNKTTLETVVDLAIGHFELSDGVVLFNSHPQPLDVRANHVRAQLWYNLAERGYRGQLTLEPVYVANCRNTPVNVVLTLPVTLGRDRIEFRKATLATAISNVTIDGSLENLRDPKTSAHIFGKLALADLKNLGNLPLALNGKDLATWADLDANADVAGAAINVRNLRLALGQSTIEASGVLKDPGGKGSLTFKAQLALGEIGRLAGVAARPEGSVSLNGNAAIDANNDYRVTGNASAQNVSFAQDGRRVGRFGLNSDVRLDTHRLDLTKLRLTAFGGEYAGTASLEEFQRYKLNGSLRNLDLRTVALALAGKDLPYNGAVSGGIDAEGDLKAPKSVNARARLAIAPGRAGIPVSGRLSADYDGARDNIVIQNSYLALPHTRLNLNGSLGSQLNVDLTTRDLNDLQTSAAGFDGGQLQFTGAVTGGLKAPRISGHVAANRFHVDGRQFDSLAADVAASGSGAAVSNGVLTRGAMQAQFKASAGLRNWNPTPNQPLTAEASIRNGDLADVMAIAGNPGSDFSGALTLDAHVSGTIGNPTGVADLQIENGGIQGEPFDRIKAQVTMADQLITIPAAYVTAGRSRVNLSAEYQHPRESLSAGRVHAHVQSSQADLAQFQTVQKQWPNTSGELQIQADLYGNIAAQGFQVTAVTADASARNLRFQGQNYGDATATARTSGQTVNYNVTSNFAGSNIRVVGNTQLVRGYPTKADATLSRFPIERGLALAKRTDIPAKGLLSGTAHVSGTLEKPEGNGDLELVNAVVYDEPIDRVRVRATYAAETLDVPQLEVAAGPSRIELAAHYAKRSGNLQVRVNSNTIDLARIQNVQKARPGLSGKLQLTADGVATITPRVMLQQLNANVSATGLSDRRKAFGDLTLVANTTAAQRLNFTLNSNLANAAIKGQGNAQLTGDYPVDAQVTFNNVAWSRIQELIGASNNGAMEILTDGQVTVNGPVMKVADLSGSLQLTRLQFKANSIVIQNQGPIAATMQRGEARITSLHLAGGNTDIQATGTASLRTQALNASVKANAGLEILRTLDREITSSGSVALAATVGGTTAKPVINGQLELKNASVNLPDVGNGIANVNGLVVFNGTTATIKNMTAESGGGKITLAGFANYSDTPRFGVRVNANNVRIRIQPGVSVIADANVRVAGTQQNSTATGTVTIEQVNYAPQSDFGSILTRAAPPVQSPKAPNPLLDNLKLEIQIRTAPAVAVQASVAQNLQTVADLRVGGTASEPSVLGRVTITEGQLNFFGSVYTVNSGSIAFYNPTRIEPVLNVNLETRAKGVDVLLTVTGPVDNMKLTYTSDPPLQFQEIVALLASGKTPTSDPTLLANQPSTPPQSFEQMGETALVSKALADPVANRLQRVFGVSQLKVDPTFVSGSELPTARLTLQQQITNSLTFTYVTALNDPNTQIIRAEWALNQQWSAVAARDQNGQVSLNFFYKKQFR